MNHYSRRTWVSNPSDLAAGDLLDLSSVAQPYWATVTRVGECADDPDREDRDCEGDCVAVIFFADDSDAPWHVTEEDDQLYARLLADADDDQVAAENAAHAAAAAARYAARLAAATPGQ